MYVTLNTSSHVLNCPNPHSELFGNSRQPRGPSSRPKPWYVTRRVGNHISSLTTPVVTICTTSLTFNNSTFCPHSVFMCFVWISEQTAIISLYIINWLVYITETVCLLRGTDWVISYNPGWLSSSNGLVQRHKHLRVEVQLHAFLTSVPAGSEQSI